MSNLDHNNKTHVNLYLIFDNIRVRAGQIFYAQNDLEAYSNFVQQFNSSDLSKQGHKQSDFTLQYIGKLDLRVGIIEPDFRIVDEAVYDDLKSKAYAQRNEILQQFIRESKPDSADVSSSPINGSHKF